MVPRIARRRVSLGGSSMRPIQLLILLVAFGAAGGAGIMAMKIAAPRPTIEAPQAAPTMKTEEVLVASQDMALGRAIIPDAVTWKVWPADGVLESYIVRSQRPDAVTELQGTLVRTPMSMGEPIKESKLVRSDRGFLSAVLPKGMRALAVRVNAASTAGGFILPNDRVDILLIRQINGDTRSETILRNIRVLAIDQTVEQVDAEKKAVVVAQDTATLELTPEQTELISQAQQQGTLALALRSIEDMATEQEIRRREQQSGISIVKFGVPTRISTGAVAN